MIMNSDNYTILAKYYDAAYSHLKDLTDIPFYLEYAEKYGDPVLEIGCGTGRILLEIAKKGIKIDGLDASPHMLAVLKRKIVTQSSSLPQKINLYQKDMRFFSLEKKYKLITIPFRGFQHLHTISDQLMALRQIKKHLRDNGVLIFDVFYPNFKILEEKMNEEQLDIEWQDVKHTGYTIKRYFVRNKLDKLHQFFQGKFIFRTYENVKMVKEEDSPLKLSYFTYPQMQLLFENCDLEIIEEFGSFKKDPVEICKEMIFVLRKKGA